MNKIIHIQLKYILIFAGIFLVLLYATFSKDVPETTVETNKTSTTKIIKKVDSAKVDVSTKTPTKTAAYFIDTITNKARKKQIFKTKSTSAKKPSNSSKKDKKDSISSKKPTEKLVVAQIYTGTKTFTNGTVDYSITSLSRILEIDLKLFTEDKIITNTETNNTTKYLNSNVWFLNVEPKFAVLPNPIFVGGAISIDFTIRNKIRFGAGVEYNNLMPFNKKVLGTFKIGIPLFNRKKL